MVDRKAIIAIALSLLFLFFYRPILKLAGLDQFMEAPERPQPTVVDETPSATPSTPPPTSPLATTPAETKPPAEIVTAQSATGDEGPLAQAELLPEREVVVETPLYIARFSSTGARLLAVELKEYAAGTPGPDGIAIPIPKGKDVPIEERVQLTAEPLFGIDLGSGDRTVPLDRLTYAVEESLDAAGAMAAVHFTARTAAGTSIRQTYRTRANEFGFDLEVELRDVPFDLGIDDYTLNTRSWPLVTESDLKADERVLRASSMVGTNVHREGVGGLLKGQKEFEGNVVWAGVQNRYFLAAAALVEGPGRGVISSAERRALPAAALERLPAGSNAEQQVAMNAMLVGLPGGADALHRFYLYVGPSEYSRLVGLDVQMRDAVDLGWAWLLPFSRALLVVLNWVFGFIGNYGLTIVVIAALVRLVLHPLNMMSMKSMRGMQKIQPEVTRLREKYKKDPQAMNTAVMALYKENKVNPAGGCLPMLLQMPLFIALYQVLFNAIELRQAPFMLWMNDLSAPDLLFSIGPFPVRVLPILMTASGFITQKMTPTDPRQMTTMYMMNVVMLVFFYNLPSGLVLYWTVMNFLTAFQQWLVLRQDSGDPVVVPAQAPEAISGKKLKRRAASR